MKAKKDSNRRVYLSDNSGKYHYPQLLENILRKKGDPYFENHEVTGSNKGTPRNPKFSLLNFFLEVEIPRLEEIARHYWSIFGKKLVIRFSFDGAGPHQCRIFLAAVREEFEKRDWIFVFQPPNSPICNTKDASIFPAMSKQLSNYQGVLNQSRGLTGETLWQVVFSPSEYSTRWFLSMWGLLPNRSIGTVPASRVFSAYQASNLSGRIFASLG